MHKEVRINMTQNAQIGQCRRLITSHGSRSPNSANSKSMQVANLQHSSTFWPFPVLHCMAQKRSRLEAPWGEERLVCKMCMSKPFKTQIMLATLRSRHLNFKHVTRMFHPTWEAWDKHACLTTVAKVTMCHWYWLHTRWCKSTLGLRIDIQDFRNMLYIYSEINRSLPTWISNLICSIRSPLVTQ